MQGKQQSIYYRRKKSIALYTKVEATVCGEGYGFFRKTVKERKLDNCVTCMACKVPLDLILSCVFLFSAMGTSVSTHSPWVLPWPSTCSHVSLHLDLISFYCPYFRLIMFLSSSLEPTMTSRLIFRKTKPQHSQSTSGKLNRPTALSNCCTCHPPNSWPYCFCFEESLCAGMHVIGGAVVDVVNNAVAVVIVVVVGDVILLLTLSIPLFSLLLLLLWFLLYCVVVSTAVV